MVCAGFFRRRTSRSLFPIPVRASAPIFPGFNYSYIGTDVQVALNELSSITDVTVLSAPSIMVENNQTASLQVGDEVPIVTKTSTHRSFRLLISKTRGVILQVKPRINASDVVALDVTQEVSDVTPTTTSASIRRQFASGASRRPSRSRTRNDRPWRSHSANAFRQQIRASASSRNPLSSAPFSARRKRRSNAPSS